MSSVCVVLLSDASTVPPVVLQIESEDVPASTPARVLLEIDTPDGPHREVWHRARRLHQLMAIYRLERVEPADAG